MPRKLWDVKQVQFSAGAPAPVLAYMDQLTEAGEGWVNVVPVGGEDEERPTSLRFMTMLNGGSPGVSMVTWIPARAANRGATAQSLGISHLTGRRAAARLASADVPVPATWSIEQDHPRRGLIVHPPAGEASETLLTWALRALTALGPAQAPASWRADVHLPSTL